MPSFSDYFKMIDGQVDLRPRQLSQAIRQDKALTEWQRNALLLQIGLKVKKTSPRGSSYEREHVPR
jgi:hypothetical protein